ncbi:MAG: hypothetical protein KIT11_09890 [Fimbriimonadaceae bacterium]|nr:hypothetical protein [Fimbriimonadaceae bacterium]QYK55635.1 MAG: hypothetical protein KF733_11560 [Fimbriimonadaceae bacterium]
MVKQDWPGLVFSAGATDEGEVEFMVDSADRERRVIVVISQDGGTVTIRKSAKGLHQAETMPSEHVWGEHVRWVGSTPA